MSNMSSFYGGRSGAPFTIVKTFDAIGSSSAEENKIIYTKSYYALDDEGNYLITTNNSIGNVQLDENNFLIKKTAENYSKYNWKLATNDGKTKINQTDFRFPEELGKDMVSFFEKGMLTLDEVNYQEYVLIDTITNLNEYSNPDNGKLFRRGMNLDNGLGGAEYIGRIIGPQGFNTGIQLDTFNSINNIPNTVAISRKVSYTDLIPGGGYIENGIPKENKDIQCIYANILDEGGNVLETKIGFKFPYLVNTFKASQVSPYADIVKNNELISEVDKDGNILSEEHPNNNPFYRHWSIKVPHGKKGDSIEDIRIQPTIIPANTPYYNNLKTLKDDIDANNNYLNKSGSISEKINIPSDAYDKLNDCIILNEGTETEPIYKYIDAKLCTNKKVFYIIRNYDETLEGSVSIPKEVGDINSIIKTDLSDNGTLTIYYDNGEIEKHENKIRWIRNTELNNSTSKLEINYNEGSKDTISPAINYIKETYISSINDQNANPRIIPNSLYVLYSDPEYNKSEQVQINGKTGGWIKLGSVTPPASNLKLLKRFKSETELDNNIPPEKLKDDEGNPLGYVAYASGVLIGGYVYLYDYLRKEWYNSEASIGETTNVGSIVNVSNQNNTPTDMVNDSVWFGIKTVGGRG